MSYCRSTDRYPGVYAYRDVFGGWTCCGPQISSLEEFAAHMADHVAKGEADPLVMERINRELRDSEAERVSDV